MIRPVPVGTQLSRKGRRMEVIGLETRIIVGGYQPATYKEGEIPSWGREVIRNHGAYKAPEDCDFFYRGWAVNGEECFSLVILQERSERKEA